MRSDNGSATAVRRLMRDRVQRNLGSRCSAAERPVMLMSARGTGGLDAQPEGAIGSMGVLIVVGKRPGKRTRLWCDQVDGDIPPDVWQVFVELFEGAGQDVLPTVSGPVACALECLLGSGPSADFPIGPNAWHQAARSAGRDLSIPDDLFEVVFPG